MESAWASLAPPDFKISFGIEPSTQKTNEKGSVAIGATLPM